jgi:hypothetical protein
MNHTPEENSTKREFTHLREMMTPLAAPPHVEAAVMKAFAKKHRASGGLFSREQLGQWAAPGTAVVTSVGVSVWLLMVGLSGGAMNGAGMQASAQKISANNDQPFIALQSLEQIALEPNPRLIETQVPKMLLAGMGVTVSPEMAGETLRAEMLVSAAGQPLALRFTSP